MVTGVMADMAHGNYVLPLDAETVNIEVKSPPLRYCFCRLFLLLFSGSKITFDRPEDEQAWQRKHAELLSIRLSQSSNFAAAFFIISAGFAFMSESDMLGWRSVKGFVLQIIWPVLVAFYWGMSRLVRLAEPSRRARYLRIAIPLGLVMLCTLTLLNQWLFWRPVLNNLHAATEPGKREQLFIFAKGFAAELAWYYTNIIMWYCAIVRPGHRAQLYICLLSSAMFLVGAEVIFGHYLPRFGQAVRASMVVSIGFMCMVGSRQLEDTNRQVFKDAIKLEAASLVKDAHIEMEHQAAEAERSLTAFLCHEVPRSGACLNAAAMHHSPFVFSTI
jgi:hypothetical protein